MKHLEQLCFDNNYARLPAGLWSAHRPIPLQAPHRLPFNPRAAEMIELDPAEAQREDFVSIITGQ